MKRETINSIIALLGLGLAAVTAWYQFGPKSDVITLVSEGRLEVGKQLEIAPFGGVDPASKEIRPVAGPVTWKIRVQNLTDRTVSLVSFKVFLLGDDDSPITYSAMGEVLSPYDASLPVQSLPVNIPANESRAYLVSLFVPFQGDKDPHEKCDDVANSLRGLERCFLEKGRDMFGNRVELLNPGSELFHAMWTDSFNGPRFAVVLETADGSTFNTQLSFLPEL